MGFGMIAAFVIFFSILLVALYGSPILLGSHVTNVHDSLLIKFKSLEKKLNTNLNIQNITYSQNQTIVEVQNTGKTQIELSSLDTFLDGSRIQRNSSNRTIQMINLTEIINPGLWDPKESIIINITRNLSSGTHFVEIFDSNAVKDLEKFQI